MAYTLVGAFGGTTSGTVPAHAIGDIIVIEAFRDGNTTAPTAGAGFTTPTNGTKAGTTCSGRLAFKIATATNDASGTWTNASRIEGAVYRPTSGNTAAMGAVANNAGTTNTVNYAALTLQDASGSSWVGGAIGHRSIDTTIESPPTGMTFRDGGVDATAEAAIHDTNGGVSSWSSTNKTITGTASGWISFTYELKDVTPPTANGWDKTTASGGTLSNSDKTFAASAGGDQAYSTATAATGLHYAEVTLSASADANAVLIGISSAGIADALLYEGDGLVFDEGFNFLTTIATYTIGDVIGIALDQTNNKAWFRVNGGNWNNSGGDNPATATGGIAFGGAGPYSAWVGANAATDTFVLNTGPTFAHTKPSGFTDWYVAAGGGAYTLPVGQGSFSLSGQAVGLKQGHRLVVDQGALSLTGQNVALRHGYPLSIGTGTFTLSGKAVALAATRRLAAGQGAFALNGKAVNLLHGWTMPAAAGMFGLTGQGVGLYHASRIVVGQASYTLSGQDVAFRRGLRLPVGQGAFGLTGENVGLTRAALLAIEAGEFSLDGQDVDLSYSQLTAYSIDVGYGDFLLSGQDVSFILGGAPAPHNDGDAGGRVSWGDPRTYRPRPRLYAYDEPKKSEPVRRRAVTRKAVRTILRRTGALNQIVSLDEAMQAAPIEVEYAVPVNSDLTDTQLYYRAIRAALMQQAQWLEQQQRQHALMLEEEAIILALAA